MSGERFLPEQSEVNATVLMGFIIDKLKLLNYEREFCSSRKPPWARLHKLYFALPSNNRNEQFSYFTSIVSWLLSMMGRKFAVPSEADDPNTVCANILVELRELGFAPPSWPPAKLKQGYGEAVCSVLDGLTSLTLEVTNFEFQAPIYRNDSYPEECPYRLDELAATTDELYVREHEDEGLTIDVRSEEMESRNAKQQSATVAAGSSVDPQAWKLEVERVAPRLRVSMVADGKDWRAHLEQGLTLQNELSKLLASGTTQLTRVETNVTSTLEKLESRDNFINLQFESLVEEYATVKDRLSGIEENHRKTLENVTALSSEISVLTDKLDHVKQLMVEKGNVISDVSPLVHIKAAIKKLKTELQEMEVRIGVLGHSFMKVGLKQARKGGDQPLFGLYRP